MPSENVRARREHLSGPSLFCVRSGGAPVNSLRWLDSTAIILTMGRNRRGVNPQRFTQSTELRLVAGFFVILYLVGGGAIWLVYGRAAALLAGLCMTGGVLLFALLYGLVWLLGRWVGE